MTFDRILLDPVITKYTDVIGDASDMENWSKANLESQYSSLLAISDDWTSEGLYWVSQRLNSGFVAQLLKREFYMGVLQKLRDLRDLFDGTPAEESLALPFDYNWIVSKIREVLITLESIDKELQALAPGDSSITTEDL
jgi:hypothetical protein